MNQQQSGDTDESSFNDLNSVEVELGRSPSRFFNEINPELFRISPRPGGYLKLIVPSRSQDFITIRDYTESAVSRGTSTMFTNSAPSMNGTYSDYRNIHKSARLSPSRDYRLATALRKSSWQKCSNCTCSSSSYVDGPSFLEESMEMLAITISCVMQLAANLEVTEDCLLWSKSYLQCIKDKQGILPRNILGILNVIRDKLAAFPTRSRPQSEYDGVDLEEKYSKTSIGSSILSRENTPHFESAQTPTVPVSSQPSSNSESKHV